MFKRSETNMDSDYTIPAKRPKYDTKKEIARCGTTGRDNVVNRKLIKSDDLWGDDFAEEDIEEMDLVASQACLEVENSFSQSNLRQAISHVQRFNSTPSTSKNVGSTNDDKVLSLPKRPFDNRRKSEITNETNHLISQIDYRDFENKLMQNREHNSTFKLQDKVVTSEDTRLKELERLKFQNKKLLNDFITKDGEAVFLRNQLQQTQLRAENDRAEKTRFIEEQANRHRSEMNAICKEKEYLKTQLELQTFEVGNLMERCKLLENGSVKLTEPHTVNANSSLRKVKCHSARNRLSSLKPGRVKETAVQTMYDGSNYTLKTWTSYYPLIKIPKLFYDTSQPEKSIVDIQIIEKTGRRNLPILQEEETFRIFENPELVKPVTTMMYDRRLTAEFIFPEVAILQRKTDSELESESSIPAINKLVSTARELILNVIVVLQAILQAMRNDDIRDMNDIYFSELYTSPDLSIKSVCDANPWHDGERGVEARRVLGVLSYVTSESIYLSKYIAGKTQLLTERDESYKHYSKQMIRYETWPDGKEFEMLTMILQFVVLVGSTRRSHQFSGLVCSIIMIICNAYKKVGYCSKGMEYAFQIFKEIVFSRPLPYCYVLLSNMMTIFVNSTTHLRKFCVNSQSIAVNNWKGALHFTPDACPLQIFLAQMENYRADLVAAIDITQSLLLFVQYILQTNVIPLRAEGSDSCNCCMKLLRFTIKTLCKCSEENLNVTDEIGKKLFFIQFLRFENR